MFRKVFVLTMLAVFLAGCDTFAALGRDIQKLGGKIEKKAEEEKN